MVFNFRHVSPQPASSGYRLKPSLARRLRQISALLALLLLMACSSNPLDKLNPFKAEDNESDRGTIGFVKGFFGGIAVDEPRAALVGRDILSSGGNAADVAVAVALTLAVTQPSSASLGGGGVCIVHDVFRASTTDIRKVMDL